MYERTLRHDQVAIIMINLLVSNDSLAMFSVRITGMQKTSSLWLKASEIDNRLRQIGTT